MEATCDVMLSSFSELGEFNDYSLSEYSMDLEFYGNGELFYFRF